MLKFKIDFFLSAYHPTARRAALRELEQILKVGRTRLNRIRRAKIGDNVNLKDWQLKALADYFRCQMEDIINLEKEDYES